jgi:hypothetical protein
VHLQDGRIHVPSRRQAGCLSVPGGASGRVVGRCGRGHAELGRHPAVVLGPGQRRPGRRREKLQAATPVRVLGADHCPADVRWGVFLLRHQCQAHLRWQVARPAGRAGGVRGVRLQSTPAPAPTSFVPANLPTTIFPTTFVPATLSTTIFPTIFPTPVDTHMTQAH